MSTPYIERSLDERLQSINSAVEQFREAVHAAEMTISADMRICEKDAAKLLGYAAGHLKNMRQEGRAPSHYCIGVGGGRVSYRLNDLASWIEGRREGWS